MHCQSTPIQNLELVCKPIKSQMEQDEEMLNRVLHSDDYLSSIINNEKLPKYQRGIAKTDLRRLINQTKHFMELVREMYYFKQSCEPNSLIRLESKS